MLAYAPRPERRRLNPSALALILGAHAIAIGAVMSARMDVTRNHVPPTIVDFLPVPPEPQPEPAEPVNSAPASRPIDTPPAIVDTLPAPGPVVIDLPAPPDPGPVVDLAPRPGPVADPPIVRTGPRFATPDGDIRPPYPESMRARDEEAILRLRLSIDERGRVMAVEPVGKADPTFLAAARRHILKAWRYKPAMAGGRAIASSTVITLQFELD